MTGVTTLLTPNPAKGNKLADGTEQTLASSTSLASAAAFSLDVDLSAMLDGDIVELRVYGDVNGGGTDVLQDFATFSGPPTIALVTSIPRIRDTGGRYKATLKQTAGTNRTYPWAVNQP